MNPHDWDVERAVIDGSSSVWTLESSFLYPITSLLDTCNPAAVYAHSSPTPWNDRPCRLMTCQGAEWCAPTSVHATQGTLSGSATLHRSGFRVNNVVMLQQWIHGEQLVKASGWARVCCVQTFRADDGAATSARLFYTHWRGRILQQRIMHCPAMHGVTSNTWLLGLNLSRYTSNLGMSGLFRD